ncbi:MAG: DNA-directed RNA polymerase [Candidatus Diapherotrites archaeon]|nr:DNA-directed RNA polymerase [Candidatus Diapherotrites archaeon]
MFYLYKIEGAVRVPPDKLTKNLTPVLLEVLREDFEGIVDEDIGVIVAVTKAKKSGGGKIIPGDGAVYFDTEFEVLAFKPEMHEVVEAIITELTEFGAFAQIGPMEGLIHVSQLMDDYINYDAKQPAFIGKKTGKRLLKDDIVWARIVTISLKGNIANSKIGLTMRQPFLGKEEWIKIDKKHEKEKAKKEGKIKAKTKEKEVKKK